MTYRDRILSCPTCATPLDKPRYKAESFKCRGCGGHAMHEDDLGRLLARYAPERFSMGKVPISPRPEPAPIHRACPACHQPMNAVALDVLPLDACATDRLVWFDPDELEAAIQAVLAERDANRGWMKRVRDLLFAN